MHSIIWNNNFYIKLDLHNDEDIQTPIFFRLKNPELFQVIIVAFVLIAKASPPLFLMEVVVASAFSIDNLKIPAVKRHVESKLLPCCCLKLYHRK